MGESVKPANVASLAAAAFVATLSAWLLTRSLVFERLAPGTSRFLLLVVLPMIYLVGASGMVLEVLGIERGLAKLEKLGKTIKWAVFVSAITMILLLQMLPR